MLCIIPSRIEEKKSICAYFNVINSFEFFVRQSPEVTKYAKKLETQISAISTMRMKFQPLMISSSKASVLPLYRCTAKYRQSTGKVHYRYGKYTRPQVWKIWRSLGERND